LRGQIRKAIRVGNIKKVTMKKYLIKASHNAAGIKGLMEEGGTKRKAAVEKMLAASGGKMEAFYYAFGKHDVYVIAELPDDVSAAAVGLRINSSGLVTVSTTVLLSPKDIDAAVKKPGNYRAPGQK
jgi:uncharacterized protein with GYD domain